LKHLRAIRDVIQIIVNRLYFPIFQKFIPAQTFRYAVCGGVNTAFDIFLYFIFYNFVLNKTIVDLGFVSVSPHIGAFFMVFPITFTTGFLLSKYITFTQSELRGHVQLFRYGVTVLVCVLLNYIFLKLFVDVMGLYPTPSKLLTTCIVIIYSYFSQKHFSFKMEKKEE
jgi:putative flippase GtrA